MYVLQSGVNFSSWFKPWDFPHHMWILYQNTELILSNYNTIYYTYRVFKINVNRLKDIQNFVAVVFIDSFF